MKMFNVQLIVAVAATMLIASCGNSPTPDPSPKGEGSGYSQGSELSTPLPSAGGVGGGADGADGADGAGGGAATDVSSLSTMGKLVAARYADLSFETALPIVQVLVKNGQHVRQGQLLVSQDTYNLRNAVEQQRHIVEQARLQIEQASLQMQDVIFSQGYDSAVTVPDNVQHNADMKAGYTLAKSRLAAAETLLAAARHQLTTATLTAPFDGVVANLTVQPHQLVAAGEPVCRIIASDEMLVEFRVMEADLAQYPMNAKVAVVPIADKQRCYEATVSEINPMVDVQGAVTLRARLTDAGDLFDGTNVEVILLNVEH